MTIFQLNRKKIWKEILLLLFFFTPVLIWCFKELTNFGTDFGFYYSGAYFISDDYSLYKEFFDHKGPVFYLFLKIIGNLIGWGIPQSIISLFFSLMVFFIPIAYFINKFCKTIFSKISMFLLSISILFGQTSNSSIAFFKKVF